MTLRAMLTEMGMASIPSILPIPGVQDAFWDHRTRVDDNYPRRAARFLDEIEWYANAMKKARRISHLRYQHAGWYSICEGNRSWIH